MLWGLGPHWIRKEPLTSMEHETVVSIALFSGIIGFVVFCVSYTFHVWRSRNAAVASGGSANRSLADRAALFSCGLFVIGCLLLIVVPIQRELPAREGLLSGDGLFTIRADEHLRLEYVTESPLVESGEVLARFRSPDHQARIKELTLKRQILEAQKQIINCQPLTPDREIVRRYQQADADRRQLFASWLHLIPERAVVARDMLRDRLDRTERINKLNTEIERSRWQLDRAAAELECGRRHAQRYESLAEHDAVTALEYDDQITEVAVLEAEVAKLKSAIEYFTRERTSIEEGLPQFRAITQKQVEQLDHEAGQAQKEMAIAQSEQQALGVQLDEDLKRAAQLRHHQLEQIDLEIRQCEAGQEGLEGVLAIRAPFRGRVEYADPAPQAALALEPVVVLSPEEGFRLSLRLPESEVASLSAAETVTLALVDPSLRRRFPGRLLEWEPLPHEPGYALAQLTCLPPTETIRSLTASEGEAIKVRLVWRPPLHVIPLFLPSVILIALGALGWGAVKLGRVRRQAVAQANPDLGLCAARDGTKISGVTRTSMANEKENEAPPWLEPALGDRASNPVGRRLQLLGQELREAIKRDEVDPAVLGSIESALDRHHAYAAPFLLLGLDHDPELPICLARYLGRPTGEKDEYGPSQASKTGSTRYRLLNILKVTAPELLVPLTGRTDPALETFQRGDGRTPLEPHEPAGIQPRRPFENGR